MSTRVVVSNAGSLPTTRQIALAVSHRLDRYLTTWAGDSASPLLRVPRLGRQFARRSLPPELASCARALLTPTELSRVALGRAGITRFNYRLIWRRNVHFDERATRLVSPDTTVVSHYGSSLATFDVVRRNGGRAVLDYPIARLDAAQALLADEAARYPDFADSTSRPYALTLGTRELRRLAEEVNQADVVVVGSRFAADSFQGVVEPARLAVVPYGVDISAFTPRTGEPRKVAHSASFSRGTCRCGRVLSTCSRQ